METPKLHGWITPEYAMQMIDEMVDWLNQQKIYIQVTYCGQPLYEPKIVGWKNVSTL